MARRGRGEGTVCQRKDGRWCAAVYVLLPNGGEKRMFVYGHTREDVYAKLVELQEKRRRLLLWEGPTSRESQSPEA
jgi:hypothetical protein